MVDKKEGEVNSSGSRQEEKRIFKEKIFSKTGPHNRPHEFKYFSRYTMPNILEHRIEETKMQFEGVAPLEVWLT